MEARDLTRQEILGDVHRQDAPVLVMIQNRGIGHLHVSIDETTGNRDLAAGKGNDFFVCPVQGSWKNDGEIVAHAILREGKSVAIGDLAAWRGNEERKRTRFLLCLPCGFRIFHDSRIIDHRISGHKDGRKQKEQGALAKFHLSTIANAFLFSNGKNF